ncbi:MAG: hypothetical protein H0T52_05270, partial [Lautropia sp.]|nr:hypothetical protein [Lautropia sp.]
MPTEAPRAVRAGNPSPAGPVTLAISFLFLLQALALNGCAAVDTAAKPPPVDEAVRAAQAAAEAARLSAAQVRSTQEPRYLRFKADETQLGNVWDDGRHTYLEFAAPASADLEFFDQEGRPVASASVGKVAAVQGLHAGILVRNSDRASFVSPNPRAASLPRAPLPSSVDFGEARAKLENQAGQLQAMQRAMDAARRAGAPRAPSSSPMQTWTPAAQP